MRGSMWARVALLHVWCWGSCVEAGTNEDQRQLAEPIAVVKISKVEGEPELGTATDFASGEDRLCAPCGSSAECGRASNFCLMRDDGSRFCGRDCRSTACRAGYTCLHLTDEVWQCVPSQAACASVAADAGSAGESADAGAITSGVQDGAGDVPSSSHCESVASWDPAWASFEEEVLRLSNLRREAGATCGGANYPPVSPLTMHPALRCAARLHARDMHERGFLSHTTPDGIPFSQRVTSAGYDWRMIGENIASGYRTPADVVDGWISSRGHCQNLLNGTFTQIGIGFFGEGDLWSQDFGAPL